MAAFSPSCASDLTTKSSQGDDEFGAAQAAPGQAAQEFDPERLGLTVAGRHAEHLAPAVGVDAHGHDHRDRDLTTKSSQGDLVVAPGLHVGGIQPDIRPVAFDRPRQEGVDALIDLAA